MDIRVIYEDDYLLVIDKPSGITVNRSDTTKDEETIQDWAEEKLGISSEVAHVAQDARSDFSKNQSLPRSLNESLSRNKKLKSYKTQTAFSPFANGQTSEDLTLEFIKRAGIVHRLDKETSGILLIAKNPDVFLNLQSQFKERKVRKTYIALVHGIVRPEEGEIDVPLGRLSFNRKRFGVVAGGRESTTRYKVLSIKYLMTGKGKEALSLLELNPKTGRTHQIRVHLKYFNHSVFSDTLYAGRKTARNDRKLLPRLFLHASEITFTHPATGEQVTFKNPLPEDLNNFLLIFKKAD
ncbi:MAG: RluA family pseudouridine synthase [Patescibacteria group bacterium]|nr:RluA family pseudouridine synthase [Patescibacteria group bacterium]